MTAALNVSPHAYIKVLHHAYKHPSTNVFGLLVGKSTQITNAIPVSHHNKSDLLLPIHEIIFQIIELDLQKRNEQIVGLYFGDCFVENNINVAQAKKRANNSEDDGEESPQQSEDEDPSLSMTDLPRPLQAFLAKLGSLNTSQKLYVWMIDNKKLSQDSLKSEIVVQQFESEDGAKNWSTQWDNDLRYSANVYGWSFQIGSDKYTEKHVCEKMVHYLEKDPQYTHLVDVQDHLDQVSLDWRNIEFEKKIRL